MHNNMYTLHLYEHKCVQRASHVMCVAHSITKRFIAFRRQWIRNAFVFQEGIYCESCHCI